MTDLAATVEGLCRFEARGPCTDAERRAANWLHDELRAAGHEAWVETHWVRPQWPLSLALHSTLGVVASLVALAAPLPALVAAVLVTASAALEASGRAGPLRWIFPRRATQNVLTVPEAAMGDAPRPGGESKGPRAGAAEGGAPAGVTLLICARYDAPRTGLAMRGGAQRLAARLRRRAGRRPPGPRAWVALALAAVAVCVGLRQLGVDGAWLGIVQFVPTVALLFALAAGGDVAVSPISPGANDNASGVAVAVALHDELRRTPPARLAPALLLFGAGEGAPLAARAHLRQERPERERIVVLELGPCGEGGPAFATDHPQLRAAAQRAVEALGTGRPAPLRRSTAARARRLPGAWIGALDADDLAPRARQTTDTPDRLDPAALERTLDFALAVVDALDADVEGSDPTSAAH